MFKSYIKALKNEFSGYNTQRLLKDIMAGLTVTAVALPLALAFGVSCGASAAAGLITAIIAGLIVSALSGASFQISGPTGAMSAVLMATVLKFQLQGVFIVCFIAGVILLIISILKLGKLVNMIPRPVITGFTSGIAIIIALGQLDNFFGTKSVGDSAISKLISYSKLGFSPNLQSVLIGAIVVVIMIVWPKIWNTKVPSSLIGIIVATIVSISFGLNVATVGEIPKTLLLEQRLSFGLIDWSRITEYITPAIGIAALGMIESLLCGASASRMKNQNFDADQELLAQGIGNIIIPFFGGVPATAAIARTSVAIKSGCQTRLCGIFHAVGLLISMFALGPVMSKLPLSALAGVLFVTAFRMNEWSEIKYFFKKRFYGAIGKFLITMVATVAFNLTTAILIGIAYAAILFIIRSTRLSVNFSRIDNEKFKGDDNVEKNHEDTFVAYITGPIFFANIGSLSANMEELDPKCNELIFSLRGVSDIDTTGVEFILELCESYRKQGISVKFCGVNENVHFMLERAGIYEIIGEDSFFWSVDRALLQSAVA